MLKKKLAVHGTSPSHNAKRLISNGAEGKTSEKRDEKDVKKKSKKKRKVEEIGHAQKPSDDSGHSKDILKKQKTSMEASDKPNSGIVGVASGCPVSTPGA
jgi:hypothetical protein